MPIKAVLGFLMVVGGCLGLIGMVAMYLWMMIWLVTIPVRFIAWFTRGGCVAFAKRLAGFLLVTCVVIPGVIILDLLMGSYLGPFSKLGWHWKAIGVLATCLGLDRLFGPILASIDEGSDSLWEGMFHDAEG
jgi:hypothetical protein